MNVKLYTRGSEYAGFRTLTTAADKPCAAPEKTAGNYDKVTIRRPAAGSESHHPLGHDYPIQHPVWPPLRPCRKRLDMFIPNKLYDWQNCQEGRVRP